MKFNCSRPRLPGPVVFMDSGIGCLPYLENARKRMPWVQCAALADRQGFPYGTKSVAELRSIMVNRIDRLIRACDPAAIVIACNTASQAALDTVRSCFPQLDIIGTVPAIKPAAKSSNSEVLAVLATEGTLSNPYLDKLIERFAPACHVIRQPATSLVEFVEHRLLASTRQEREAAIAPYIEDLVKGGADTIVLGCTHFLHLSEEAKSAAARLGANVAIVDSREGVSKRLESLLVSGETACKAVGRAECNAGSGIRYSPESSERDHAGNTDNPGRNDHDKAIWRDRFYLSGNAEPEESYRLWAAAFELEGPIPLGE